MKQFYSRDVDSSHFSTLASFFGGKKSAVIRERGMELRGSLSGKREKGEGGDQMMVIRRYGVRSLFVCFVCLFIWYVYLVCM